MKTNKAFKEVFGVIYAIWLFGLGILFLVWLTKILINAIF